MDDFIISKMANYRVETTATRNKVGYLQLEVTNTRNHCNKEQSGLFTIRGHKYSHHGYNKGSYVIWIWMQLLPRVVHPSALSDDTVSTPTEVFAVEMKFKGVARLPNGKKLQQLGAHQP
jgi:hypothetical protein